MDRVDEAVEVSGGERSAGVQAETQACAKDYFSIIWCSQEKWGEKCATGMVSQLKTARFFFSSRRVTGGGLQGGEMGPSPPRSSSAASFAGRFAYLKQQCRDSHSTRADFKRYKDTL